MILVLKVIRNVIICYNFKLDVLLLTYKKGFFFCYKCKRKGRKKKDYSLEKKVIVASILMRFKRSSIY